MGKRIEFLTQLFLENRNDANAGPMIVKSFLFKKQLAGHCGSKTNSESVKEFLQKHEVSRLSFREGSKYITWA